MEDEVEEKIPKFYGVAVVGERGQIVIPVEARHDMGITAGEKMVILSGPQRNILMIAKAESVSQLLSKVMKHISQFESVLKAEDESSK